MDTDELAQVLAYLNAVRAHCGLLPLAKIPLGAAPDATNELSRQCPLAQALPQTVVGADFLRTPDRQRAEALSQAFTKPLYGMIEFPGEYALDLPEVWSAFIQQYDEGHLPQFIKADAHA